MLQVRVADEGVDEAKGSGEEEFPRLRLSASRGSPRVDNGRVLSSEDAAVVRAVVVVVVDSNKEMEVVSNSNSSGRPREGRPRRPRSRSSSFKDVAIAAGVGDTDGETAVLVSCLCNRRVDSRLNNSSSRHHHQCSRAWLVLHRQLALGEPIRLYLLGRRLTMCSPRLRCSRS